jgi:hypothetical protein
MARRDPKLQLRPRLESPVRMRRCNRDRHVLASIRRYRVIPGQDLNTASHHMELLDLPRVQVRPRAAADLSQANQELGMLFVVIRAAQDLDMLPAERALQLIRAKPHPRPHVSWPATRDQAVLTGL